MECGVCFHVYDEDNRRPRSMGCGHTFCSCCTAEMIDPLKGLSCPTCRTVHDVNQLAQIPVNYSLMEILKLLELSEDSSDIRPKEEAENFPPPSAPSPENLPGDRCEDHHQSWQYRCVPCNQWMCRDCMVIEHLDRGCRVISSKQALEEMMEQSNSEAKDRLSYYETRITRMRQYDSELEMHLQKHESQLRGLVMTTERQHRFVKMIQEERERVGRALREGREAKRVLEVNIRRSVIAKSQEELTQALGNTQMSDARLQEWVSSCLLEFNTSGRKNLSIKQLVTTASALRIINDSSEETDKEAGKGIYAVLDNARSEQVAAVRPKCKGRHTISLNSDNCVMMLCFCDEALRAARVVQQGRTKLLLNWLAKPWRSLSEGAGSVQGFKGAQSNVKWGRLSLSYGHILLHALQSSNPPANALNVQFPLVRSLVPTDSPVVFLNVAVSGKYLGRLYLRLLGDTERARQFLQLCTGEKGPCYRSTRFFSLQRPGEPGECLLGGDYDRGDGTGGFPLLEGLGPSSVYRAPVTEGLVAGSNGQHSALFGIFLRDWLGVSDTAIGHVIKNLELLQVVASSGKFRQLQVVDCGLVVPV